jgi:predicted phosphodiesterase
MLPAMNRRELLKAGGAVAVGTVAGGAATTPGAAAPAPKADPATAPAVLLTSAPVLTARGPGDVDVLVGVSRLATGWVEYGPDETLGTTVRTDTAGQRMLSDRLLRVTLAGLAPGRTYFYRVCVQEVDFAGPYKVKPGEVVRTPVRSFRTLDPSAGRASFNVWNDTHENADTLAALAEHRRQNPTDFLLWNGDVTNDIHQEDKIVGQFLSPGGQAYAKASPVLFTRGNHDVRGRDARRLVDYVPGPYHYAFRHGPVACVVLDSGEDKPDALPVYAGLNNFDAYRTAQAAWLERALAAPEMRSAPYRVVFVHIPLSWDEPVPERWTTLYGPGIKGWVCDDGRAKWGPSLAKWGAQVVISGHTHKHACFDPAGDRPWTQVIGGGPKPDVATTITGDATPERLALTVRDLSGRTLIERTFKPVA